MNIQNDQYTQFIPKDDQELPDCFGVKFDLRNGNKIFFEVINCTFIPNSQCFEILTTEEEFKLFPKDVVAQVTYDKRFYKILEIKKKLEKSKESVV